MSYSLSNKIRLLYNRYPDRPYQANNFIYNYVLVDEGLDIVWNKMDSHLEQFINNVELHKVDCLLKINIQLYTPPELVVRLRDSGVIVTFNNRLTSLTNIPLHPLQVCENIKENVTNGNIVISLNYNDHRMVIEFFKLANITNYYSIDYLNWVEPMDITIDEVLEVISEGVGDYIRYDCIQPILSTGYIPPIDYITECRLIRVRSIN